MKAMVNLLFCRGKNNEHILAPKPLNMMFLNVQSEIILKIYMPPV